MATILGIDVGGTSTDAVLLNAAGVRAKAKVATTEDVYSGIKNVISQIADQHGQDLQQIELVCLGTTHFINALIRNKDLASVAVLRFCGPATRALPPLCDITSSLCTGSRGYMLPGGYEYDGKTEITPVNEKDIQDAVHDALLQGITSFVISGVFSPIRSSQELQAKEIVQSSCESGGKDVHITLSHEVGQLGLLEREDASFLNAALRPLASRVIPAFQRALQEAGIQARLQLTSNDGTLISAQTAQKLPIATIQSGPVNSLRGAAALTGLSDAIVLDIGGTTTDLGVLVKGLPRPGAATVHIAGVRTNFAMPDLHSIGLGGGSHLTQDNGEPGSTCRVGPESVGQHLTSEALCFGGQTMTATDVAVALGRMSMPGSRLPSGAVRPEHAEEAWRMIQSQLERSLDQMKASKEDMPVIVVGGGAALCGDTLPGASEVIRPQHADVANAVGAAIAQVSGVSEGMFELGKGPEERARAIAEATESAVQRAIEAVEEVPLAYLPGGLTRVQVRAVGSLEGFSSSILHGAHTQGRASSLALSARTTLEASVGIKSETSIKSLEPSSAAMPFDQQRSSRTAAREADIPFSPPSRQFDEDGAWILTKQDVEALSIDCGILGTGGGGDPYTNRLKVLRELDRGGVIRVIEVDAVPDEALVAEAGGMGAPTVGIEKLNAFECEAALRGHFSRDPKGEGLFAVMSCEIGGANGLEPLAIAARMELPVVDADFMGRAFPELQMMTSAIYGHELAPAVLADEKGNVVRVDHAASPQWLESLFRPVCTAMGCAAGLSTKPLTGAELRRVAIPGTLSLAWRLGQAVLHARQANTNAVAAVMRASQGVLLFSGKIMDVQRETSEGFARGTITVEGADAHRGKQLQIDFQNENLVAHMDGSIIACVPDLICCLESEGGAPISTEALRYGLRVSVLALPAHPMLQTKGALCVVGPAAFGYSCAYKPTVAAFAVH
ncbi:g2030 [Coccomyxa viridis]|uniref:G2030 protein n=1 Tax=Coccomyxa viridis TaxID=1274662 RepID=A0ABP1FLK3_9CHLO